MTSSQRDFLAYINGRVMPYSEAAPILQRINARSAGGYYDTARTFGGKTFRLRQHLERLFNGLTYSNIDTGLSIEDMEDYLYWSCGGRIIRLSRARIMR